MTNERWKPDSSNALEHANEGHNRLAAHQQLQANSFIVVLWFCGVRSFVGYGRTPFVNGHQKIGDLNERPWTGYKKELKSLN
jgi:hypothetical protein